MKHLGDITKISGYTAPIVDCIIGGSPCQDLSVAGKRAGLDGERSGLYIEQVRIVKEMRKQDELNGKSGVDIRPRYMVWENVPGAFSSNKGEDFRIVLEELAKVKDENAVIPMPDKEKWTNSGCVMGDGWSIAWRVLDAQFWGVPQRRRRIALVADFGGQSAPEILFVRKSMSGYSDESEPKRKEASSDASRGIGADDREGTCYGIDHAITTGGNCTAQGPCVYENIEGTLKASGPHSVCYGISSYDSNAMKSSNPHSGIYEADTSRTLDLNGGNPTCNQGGIAVVQRGDIHNIINSHILDDQGGSVIYVRTDGKSPTIRSQMGGHPPVVMQPYMLKIRSGCEPAVCYGWYPQMKAECITWTEDKSTCLVNGTNPGFQNAVCYPQQAYDKYIEDDVGTTLKAMGGSYGGGSENLVLAVDYRNGSENDVNGALQSNSAHSLNGNNVVRTRYIVRRLTPLECERLQGYPDNWTRIGEVVGYERQVDENTGEEFVQAIYEYIDANGKKRKTSDAARYKALGNSIALPPWKWVLKRLCACYERDATMASLFDGIGGFPYLWEQLNGKGSCLWASEIEEFPIAVTKVRIGE